MSSRDDRDSERNVAGSAGVRAVSLHPVRGAGAAMRGLSVAVVVLGGCGGHPRLGPGGGPDDTARGRADTGAPSDSSGADSGAGATDTGGSPSSSCDRLVADPLESNLVLGSSHGGGHVYEFVSLRVDGERACITHEFWATYRRGGVLTALGAERARSLAAGLVGVDLNYTEPSCGCPEMEESRLELRRQGPDETFITSRSCVWHGYPPCDFEFMPPELVPVDAFVAALEQALLEGTTTEDVVSDTTYEYDWLL